MREIKGKVAVVTGGGFGIGREISQVFAEAGARVLVADINEQNAQTVAREISEHGGVAKAYRLDVADKESVARFAEAACAEFGGVDILINNAGVGAGGRFEEIPIENWQWVFGVNVFGQVNMIRAFMPGMKEKGAGHIVNLVSSGGFASAPYLAPYISSKFASLGLTEVLHAEAARYGIGVTAVCPAVVKDTNLISGGRETGESAEDEKRRQMMLDVQRKYGYDKRKLARRILNAVRRNQPVLEVPFFGSKFLHWLKRLLPGVYRWTLKLVADLGERQLRKQ